MLKIVPILLLTQVTPKTEARDLPILWGIGTSVPEKLHYEIEAAFEWWNCTTGSRITYPVGLQDFKPWTGDSGVVVMIHHSPNKCPWNHKAAATTYMRYIDGRIVHGEIVLWTCNVPYCTRLITMHEIGHLLGLVHYTSDVNLMAPIITSIDDTLTETQKGRVLDVVKARKNLPEVRCAG